MSNTKRLLVVLVVLALLLGALAGAYHIAVEAMRLIQQEEDRQ